MPTTYKKLLANATGDNVADVSSTHATAPCQRPAAKYASCLPTGHGRRVVVVRLRDKGNHGALRVQLVASGVGDPEQALFPSLHVKDFGVVSSGCNEEQHHLAVRLEQGEVVQTEIVAQRRRFVHACPLVPARSRWWATIRRWEVFATPTENMTTYIRHIGDRVAMYVSAAGNTAGRGRPSRGRCFDIRQHDAHDGMRGNKRK